MESVEDIWFRSVVISYTERRRFIRRPWLTAELEALLADPQCRLVLLTGEPGIGKSAFIAQVAQEHETWAVYFNRRDQRIQLADGSAKSMLLRIGLQLATAFPALFDTEQVRLTVQQRVGELAADSQLVAAEVDRIVSSPFHQIILEISQTISRLHGGVVGLRAHEWITEPRLIDVPDLAAMALIDPAYRLLRQQSDAQIVVLVDAVDEATDELSGTSIVDWLAAAPELPPNVRLVLTSREDDRLLNRLKGHADALRSLRIDGADVRVQQDLRRLAEDLSTSPSVVSALTAAGRNARDFVSEAVVRADGNIGYLDAIARAIDERSGDAESRMAIDALLSLDQLPGALTELYVFFMRQLQAGPGRRGLRIEDPETGRPFLANTWTELMWPTLAVLSTAFEPLTAEQLVALTGTMADRTAMHDALRHLSQFLHRTAAGWQLYHATVAEFLVSQQLLADPATADLAVDARETHSAIARRLGRDSANLWLPASNDRIEEARRAYARLHYPRHLYYAEQWEKLFSLLDDGTYGAGKLAADPSGFQYSLDLDMGFAAATGTAALEAGGLALLPRAWKYRMLRNVLVSPTTEPPPLAYATLARLGRTDEAVSLVRLIQDPYLRSSSLAQIAQHAEPVSATRHIWLDAVQSAGLIANQASRSAALSAILGQLRDSEALSEHGSAVAASCEEAALSIVPVSGRCSLLASIADTYRMVEQQEEFARVVSVLEATLADAENSADEDDHTARQIRGRLVQLYLSIQDHARAAQTLSVLTSFGQILEVLRPAAWGGQRSWQFDQILGQLANVARSDTQIPAAGRAWARALMAYILSAYGDTDAAADLVSAAVFAASDPGFRPTPTDFEKIAHLVAPLDHQALRRLADILRYEPSAFEVYMNARSAPQLVAGMVSFGPFEERRYDVLRPDDGRFDVAPFLRAAALANLGFPDDALHIAGSSAGSEKLDILGAVIRSLCAAGRLDDALRVADQLEVAASAISFKFSIFKEPVAFLEPASEVERARATIAAAAAENLKFDQASAIVGALGDIRARCYAMSVLAFHEAQQNQHEAASAHLAEAFRLWRDEPLNRQAGPTALLVTEILSVGQAWTSPRFAMNQLTWLPSKAQVALIQALIQANQLAVARPAIATTKESNRVGLLVELAVHASLEEARTALTEAEHLSLSHVSFSSINDLRSIASQWMRIGDSAASARVLRTAAGMIESVWKAQYAPDQRAWLCGDWIRAGSTDGALALLNQIPSTDLFSLLHARCAISKANAETGSLCGGAALDVQQSLESTVEWLPAVDARLRAHAAARLAVEFARHGRLDRALDMAESDQDKPTQVVLDVAEFLVASGQLDSAEQLFADASSMPDNLTTALVDTAISSGDLQRALDLAGTRRSKDASAILMARIARRSSGLAADLARTVVQATLDMLPQIQDNKTRRSVIQDLAWAIADLDGDDGLLRVVHQTWSDCIDLGSLVDCFLLAGPLCADRSEFSIELASSLPWVSKSLRALT
jgi:hypothetical protein